MNAETLKKPWLIALIVFAILGLLAVGFFGSRLILGRRFGDGGFPRSSFGAIPFFGGDDRVGGQILELNEDRFSIESEDGEEYEFSITNETEISVDGGMDGLEVGAFAFVQYESADDGSLTALFVGSQPERGIGRQGPFGGQGRSPGGGRGQE